MTKLVRFNKGVEETRTVFNFYFDNGVWVGICKEFESWEYQEEDDEETYMEGSFMGVGKYVEDYDGCYELPEEVKKALRKLGYSTAHL